MKNIMLNWNNIYFCLVLVRAIQALSRVGDDIYIETQASGFSIKTMNSNKSGYISVIFYPNFFTEFNPGDTEESNKCKILIKSCLNVFKNMNKVFKKICLKAICSGIISMYVLGRIVRNIIRWKGW